MRKYTTAPHPFIIEPPHEGKNKYDPDEEITFNLILIGKGIDYIPYFIYTFSELGNTGIGRAKGRYELRKVVTHDGTIYSSDTGTLKAISPASLPLDINAKDFDTDTPSSLTIQFLTPTRIVYNGHLAPALEFHMLIRNLLRRISLLYYFHCGGDPSGWDFRGLIKKAEAIKVKDSHLRWQDIERYSTRQNTRMKLGGFVGEITFEGNIDPFMPLLRAGEVLHVGKATAFGLGQFRII